MANISVYSNSVAPLSATPLDYGKIQVTWNLPNAAGYKLLRLVRNQYAYPENQEDGYILYEFDPVLNTGLYPVTTFTDGVDSSLSVVTLVAGEYVYYTVWLLLANDTWVIAGQDKDIVAKNHGVLVPNTPSTYLKTTHDKVMELLPRTYTSASGSPFDVVDTTSDLHKFLKGFSLTYDEFMTLAELTIPFLDATRTADSIVPVALNHLGLRNTSILMTGSKKGLIQKAGAIVPYKGTANSLAIFAETFTGYNTAIKSSANTDAVLGVNLMLNAQDSSFHRGGQGAWQSITNTTLTVEGGPNVTLLNGAGASSGNTVTVTSTAGLIVGQVVTVIAGTGAFTAGTTVQGITNGTTFTTSANIATTLTGATIYAYTDIPTAEQYSFKSPYRLKVNTTASPGASEFRLGSTSSSPSTSEAIGYGIPISGGISYSFNYYAKRVGAVTLLPYISWFDAYGNALSTNNSSGDALTTSWAKYTLTATSPGYSQQASGYVIGSSTTTIILPSTHTFNTTTNNKIYIEDDGFAFNGVFTVTAYSTTSITIGYGLTSTLGTTLTSVNSTAGSATITVSSTANLQVGQVLSVIANAGAFAPGTYIQSITDATHFVASSVPTTTLANATILAAIDRTFTVFKANTGNTSKETPAAYAMIGFKTGVTSPVTWYIDCMSFAPASYTTFVEARSVDIYFDPSKVNYLIDPSFAANGATNTPSTGWASSSSGSTFSNSETTTLTGLPYINTTTTVMGKVVTGTTSGTAALPDLKTAAPTPIVNNNDYYTFSMYIKGAAAYSLTLGLTQGGTATITGASISGSTVTYTASNTFIVGSPVVIIGVVSSGNGSATAGSGYNISGTIVTASSTQFTVNVDLTQVTLSTFGTYTSGGSARITVETPISVTTSWQRVSVTAYVTSTATGLTPYIYGTRSATQTINFDAAQLEQIQIPTDYFDGSFVNQGGVWSGIVNASKSYLYVNKDQKLSELNTLVNDWLPINTPYYIRTITGVETTGLPAISTIDYGYKPITLYNQSDHTNVTYKAL